LGIIFKHFSATTKHVVAGTAKGGSISKAAQKVRCCEHKQGVLR